ncbi:MAG: threonine synthase [Treponema sp.]|jgi:threonine synthase|nr:threonine synthase [Treponema sp.]
MHYYSTRSKTKAVSFTTAALEGLAPDGGLYVPETIPQYSTTVKNSLATMDFSSLAFETIYPFVSADIPPSVLEIIVHEAFSFPAPVVPVADRLILELFHGPTAAFKDFGARFMARIFSYVRRGEDKALHILVATSGDTGGAVAAGFLGIEGINVTVLYPHGRVSPLQERQIAGLGANIRALAVEGSFDDCQRLVKAAFSDPVLKKQHNLSSANSINVSRLIPQIPYYSASAAKVFAGRCDADEEATPRKHKLLNPQLLKEKSGKQAIISVPSGNFGNLTAGLYAKKMGAPIQSFIAATNANKIIPNYLESGYYEVQPTKKTLSNAMDVGNPSNFERMAAHFSLTALRECMIGISVSDNETKHIIQSVFNTEQYFLDPHTAVGYRASHRAALPVIVLATAHPAKFADIVEPLTETIPVPASLTIQRNPQKQIIPADLSALMEFL